MLCSVFFFKKEEKKEAKSQSNTTVFLKHILGSMLVIHSQQASVEADRVPGTALRCGRGREQRRLLALFSWNLHPVWRERKEERKFPCWRVGMLQRKMRRERAHGWEVLT